MYPLLERNILSFMNNKLNLTTPAEVAITYMQLIRFKESAMTPTDQSRYFGNQLSP
jgi:hypothetical protein